MAETIITLELTDRDFALSPNFSSREFRCSCCGKLIVDRSLIDAMQLLRDRLAQPLVITSGYRCPEHNRTVGGVSNSAHMRGRAADVAAAPAGLTPLELGKAAAALMNNERRAFSHIGIYDGYQGKHGFVHLGIGGKSRDPKIWGDW
jgi:uncharacterized protein YcbK (DUF882 family)